MSEMDEMLDRVRALLEERLEAKGKTLARQLDRARAEMPRGRRRDGKVLVRAEEFAGHPKMAMLVSGTETVDAGTRMIEWLESVDPRERRITRRLWFWAGLSFSLILVVGVTVAVLMGRGLI